MIRAIGVYIKLTAKPLTLQGRDDCELTDS